MYDHKSFEAKMEWKSFYNGFVTLRKDVLNMPHSLSLNNCKLNYKYFIDNNIKLDYRNNSLVE